jgi:hypothetical protein
MRTGRVAHYALWWLVSLSVPGAAQQILIDFTFPHFTELTNQYPGVHFYADGGAPIISNSTVYGSFLVNAVRPGRTTTSLSIQFDAPVTDVSFLYNYLGVALVEHTFNGAEVIIPTSGPGGIFGLDSWFRVDAGNSPFLRFDVFFDGIAFGIDDLRYTPVLAAPGPIAGGGLPAIIALLGGYLWRSRKLGTRRLTKRSAPETSQRRCR